MTYVNLLISFAAVSLDLVLIHRSEPANGNLAPTPLTWWIAVSIGFVWAVFAVMTLVAAWASRRSWLGHAALALLFGCVALYAAVRVFVAVSEVRHAETSSMASLLWLSSVLHAALLIGGVVAAVMQFRLIARRVPQGTAQLP